MSEATRARGPLARWSIGVGVLYGLLVAVTITGYLASDKTNEPNGCDGIGFGCTLPPNESFVLVGMLVGVVLLPVCGVVGAVMTVRARHRRSRVPAVVAGASGEVER